MCSQRAFQVLYRWLNNGTNVIKGPHFEVVVVVYGLIYDEAINSGLYNAG